MKKQYEHPESELLTVNVTNFFCTTPQPVTQSDEGMESYEFGGTW